MTRTIRTLGSQGDTAVEYDLDTGEAVKEAERILAQAQEGQAGLFDGTTKEQIKAPTTPKGRKAALGEHEEILIVPRMAGG
jgi:hypothetical protein